MYRSSKMSGDVKKKSRVSKLTPAQVRRIIAMPNTSNCFECNSPQVSRVGFPDTRVGFVHGLRPAAPLDGGAREFRPQHPFKRLLAAASTLSCWAGVTSGSWITVRRRSCSGSWISVEDGGCCGGDLRGLFVGMRPVSGSSTIFVVDPAGYPLTRYTLYLAPALIPPGTSSVTKSYD